MKTLNGERGNREIKKEITILSENGSQYVVETKEGSILTVGKRSGKACSANGAKCVTVYHNCYIEN